jgi:DNA-binding MarR family transcriptional regulator
MNHGNILEQAQNFATLLRSLMRELAAGLDDPAVNLPLAQLRVCNVLYGGSRPMSALGRELGVSLSAITQIADRLERARLVKRVAQGDDRRVRSLRLTPRGEKMMRLHEEARIGRMSAALVHLRPKQRQDITQALQMLIDASAASKGHNGDTDGQSPHFSKSEAML